MTLNDIKNLLWEKAVMAYGSDLCLPSRKTDIYDCIIVHNGRAYLWINTAHDGSTRTVVIDLT